MIYKFRLISNEVKGFVRDIEIGSDQYFYDLHSILSNDFHYDSSQLASFFISNANWEKIQEITLFDFSEGKSKNVNMMDKSLLKNFISNKGDRLLYIFDYFNKRHMFLELMELIPKDKNVKYPRIIHSKLSPPPQMLVIDTNFDDLEFDE